MISEEHMTKEYNIFAHLCSNAREKGLTDIMSYLLPHVFPSCRRTKPSWHWQLYELLLLMHTCSQPWSMDLHRSLSENCSKNPLIKAFFKYKTVMSKLWLKLSLLFLLRLKNILPIKVSATHFCMFSCLASIQIPHDTDTCMNRQLEHRYVHNHGWLFCRHFYLGIMKMYLAQLVKLKKKKSQNIKKLAMIFHEGSHLHEADSIIRTQITHYCCVVCFIFRSGSTKQRLNNLLLQVFPSSLRMKSSWHLQT